MTQSFKVALVGFEPMRRHQSDPTLTSLSTRPPRWYLTIQEFGPTFKYLLGLTNVVADSLSRNVPVGSVAEMPSQIENFTLQDLAAAQRQHGIWSKVVFALESGDETSLPQLPVSFSHFSCLR